MNYIKKTLLYSVYTILLIEIFSISASKLNLLHFNYDPDYIKSYGNNWRTEKEPWGSWHKPNYQDRQTSDCFDVIYESNNIGARDNKNYDLESKDTSIIILGDSFAEGMGVSLENILAKKIEEKVKKKVLNFGSAGHFGPLQSKIIYEKLASKYNHDQIIFLFYPHNDFIDNDWNYWKKKIRKYRNRPYFIKKKETDIFETYYPNKNHGKIELFFKDLIFFKIQPFFLKYTYTANTLRTLNYLYSKSSNKKDNENNSNVDSNVEIRNSYFFNNNNSVNGTIYSISSLLSLSVNIENKSIIIIPTLQDLKLIEEGENYKILKWYRDLKNLALKTNTNLIDIAEYLTFEQYRKLIFSCDQHWNADGHDYVYNIVIKKLFNN